MKNKIHSSEITPEAVYVSRRRFLKNTLLTAIAATMTACAPGQPGGAPSVKTSPTTATEPQATIPGLPTASLPSPSELKDELGDPATTYEAITSYNNYYEFSYDKSSPAMMSKNLVTSPWQVKIGGLVRNPMTLDVDDLRRNYDQEERIYRHRCVEAWSMVIPWVGFPLAKLLKDADPTSEAKYVRFEALKDPKQFPGQSDLTFDWPYIEGLRIDEGMNDLALLVTGVYGKTLLPQNGAPLRLAVPWKYGFKSIKAIVKIDLVKDMPTSLWMSASPNEYGFYANVNPDVPHPRWSQSTERRIGEASRKATLKFNGYQAKVESIYQGMDLRKNF